MKGTKTWKFWIFGPKKPRKWGPKSKKMESKIRWKKSLRKSQEGESRPARELCFPSKGGTCLGKPPHSKRYCTAKQSNSKQRKTQHSHLPKKKLQPRKREKYYFDKGWKPPKSSPSPPKSGARGFKIEPGGSKIDPKIALGTPLERSLALLRRSWAPLGANLAKSWKKSEILTSTWEAKWSQKSIKIDVKKHHVFRHAF